MMQRACPYSAEWYSVPGILLSTYILAECLHPWPTLYSNQMPRQWAPLVVFSFLEPWKNYKWTCGSCMTICILQGRVHSWQGTLWEALSQKSSGSEALQVNFCHLPSLKILPLLGCKACFVAGLDSHFTPNLFRKGEVPKAWAKFTKDTSVD